MPLPAGIRRVAGEFWDGLLEAEPLAGTEIADPRFDDRLPDPGPDAARAARHARRAGVARRPPGRRHGHPRLRL
ncbi:MAG: hypothetical protein ACRDKW_04655 [Actinomycetota bacterium]